MNLQANRKSIKRVVPSMRFGQMLILDKHINHDYRKNPNRRTQIKATGEYVRNITEARRIVANMLKIRIGIPFIKQDVLIDVVRGKYNI